MKRVAIIPARGGSRRVPRKNIREFHGKPMIWYPIKVAMESGLFDRIVVSTDDVEIDNVARRCAVDLLEVGANLAEMKVNGHHRPPCDGTMGTQEVAAMVLHDAPESFDAACVIYPCTPMLTPEDLNRGWAPFEMAGVAYSMAVHADPLADAGQFYWSNADALLAGAPLIDAHTAMVPVPEWYVDINTPEDWARAEAIYAEHRHNAMLNQRGHV